MRHTQEELAAVLNRQRARGIGDARLQRDYGHGSESAAYPNAKFPDVTRQAVRDAYDYGWATERRRMNKPDAICAAVFGKGVRHEVKEN